MTTNGSTGHRPPSATTLRAGQITPEDAPRPANSLFDALSGANC